MGSVKRNYWNANIPLYDASSSYTKDDAQKIGKNYYFGPPLEKREKRRRQREIITVIALSIIVPILIPYFLYNNTYRHVGKNIQELRHKKNFKCVSDILNHSRSQNRSLSSQSSLSSIPLIHSNREKSSASSSSEELISSRITVEKLLENIYETSSLDTSTFLAAQDIHNNPLIKVKDRFLSIYNKDDFYQNSITPSLKALAFLISSNPMTGAALYEKWKNTLENVANTWKASGSETIIIDDLFPIPVTKAAIFFSSFTNFLTFIGQTHFKIEEFLDEIETLNIPETLDFHFAISNEEAISLLDAYLIDPSETNLSSLFSSKTLQKWPKNCQFLLGFILINTEKNNLKLRNNTTYRELTLNYIKEKFKTPLPPGIQALLAAATSNSWIARKAFDIALPGLFSLLCGPETREEAQRLEGLYSVDFDIFQQAIQFSKTAKRKQFDQEYCQFVSMMQTDVMTAVRAKHTTDPELIGQLGKEFNLQELIREGITLEMDSMNNLKCLRDYLEELNQVILDPSELATKKNLLQEAESKSILLTLTFIKKMIPTLRLNNNYMEFLRLFDNTILPSIQGQPLIDLEHDPIIPWLQTHIFSGFHSISAASAASSERSVFSK